MEIKKYGLPVLIFGLGLGLSFFSCQHEPFTIDGDITPIDTTGNNNPTDTTGNNPTDTMATGTPCDPDVVYFELEVLPILRSNCAKSGCHDENSAQKGVILTSYESVMATGEITPFNLSRSDLYEVITENDPDKRMPQAPNPPLSSSQVSLVAEWILQGAKNESCDPGAGGCDTTAVSYVSDIRPILESNCLGCHQGPNPVGGFVLEAYDNVVAKINEGRFYGALAWETGFVPMPYGAAEPLPDCDLLMIRAWINAGAPEN
ncbi:MAG: hypothetical protein H6558_11115 [Lewinellaceae bacterium]|nr:hypothetical protein [Lewinellaceae bacterium]MCB9288473.1 hypothetical protein [Lewinellaceae bacterium]